MWRHVSFLLSFVFHCCVLMLPCNAGMDGLQIEMGPQWLRRRQDAARSVGKYMAARHRPLQQVWAFIITLPVYTVSKKNLKVYCIETKPMSNEYWPCFSIDAPVLTETTKWLLWPRQFYAMTERWRGSRRPSTNPSAKSMSSTSRSTSKPATWNSVHGLRMAIR